MKKIFGLCLSLTCGLAFAGSGSWPSDGTSRVDELDLKAMDFEVEEFEAPERSERERAQSNASHSDFDDEVGQDIRQAQEEMQPDETRVGEEPFFDEQGSSTQKGKTQRYLESSGD